MATEYHLLTCLGRDGLTITAATSDVITLAAHGMRSGHPVRFTTTGTLPAGLSVNTTYYVSATDLLAGSFKVSATDGGSVVDITSTGSGTHKCIGAYWATLPATDPGGGGNYKARYGSPGSERCYKSWGVGYQDPTSLAWGMTLTASITKDIIVEVEGAWTDTTAYPVTLTGYKSCTIWAKIQGVYSNAHHKGVIGAGYKAVGSLQYGPMLNIDQPNCIVDGISVTNSNAHDAIGFGQRAVGIKVNNCILSAGRYGIMLSQPSQTVTNNIIYNCGTGIFIDNTVFGLACLIAFNLIHGCTTAGISLALSQYTPGQMSVLGNISTGNTKNYSIFDRTVGGGRFTASNNFGDSTDIKTVTFENSATPGTLTCRLTAHGFTVNTPIRFTGGTAPAGITLGTLYYLKTVATDTFTLSATFGGTAISYSNSGSGTITISLVWDTANTIGYVSSTDFVDYANHNFYPASLSSPQVESVNLLDGDGLPRYDIADAVRPNYINALTDKADAGPFEFDHGYGLAPQQVTVDNLVAGSIVKISRVDTGEILDTATESSGIATLTAGYSGAVNVEARRASSAPFYKPWVTQITIPGTTSVTALQELD